MSAFSLLSIGASAMAANYTALQTTGNNIANANVAGYSRQRVEFATATSRSTSSGSLGLGVDVKAVTRSHDEFLARESNSAQSSAQMDKARLAALRKLEDVFRPGETGVGYAAGQFLNALTDLASRPADEAVRQAVLARADEVAGRFVSASQAMDSLQADIKAALEDGVKRINGLAQSLAQVNQKIVAFSGSQSAPNDLLDQRDRLLNQLSEKVQVKTVFAADNSVSVFVGDGRPLVMGSDARALTVEVDPADASRSTLAMKDGSGVRLIGSDFLGGGDLAGMLKFQDEDLVRARTLLGQMASALTAAVNRQQSMGLDLAGRPGADVFFGFHDTTSTGALSMVRPASTNKGGVVPVLTIEDPSKLQAAEYTLAYDKVASAWMLESSQGGALIPAAQANTLGLNLTIPAGVSQDDRFLLQPVTYAAGMMRRQLTRPEELAAAAPVTAERQATNRGTAAVASLRVTVADAELVAAVGTSPIELRFTGTNTLSVTPPVEGVSNLTWTPGQPLLLGGVEVTLSGRPAPADASGFTGDAFVISATTQVRQNNGNALGLAALAEASFVGRTASGQGGATVTDAYAYALADIGTRVQGATTSSDISTAVADQAQSRRSSVDGVNLDEEAARLIQSQQAYQASAKVLQVAQSIFDTLLQAAAV